MELSILGVKGQGDRIRYREETALYRTHMAIFSKSCSVAVVYRVTDIYRAVVTYWFDYRFFFWLLIRQLIRGNAYLIEFGTLSF